MALAAPALVRASSIMPVRSSLILPWGDPQAPDFFWHPESRKNDLSLFWPDSQAEAFTHYGHYTAREQKLETLAIAAGCRSTSGWGIEPLRVSFEGIAYRYGWESNSVPTMERLAALAEYQRAEQDRKNALFDRRSSSVRRARNTAEDPVKMARLRAKYGDEAVDDAVTAISASVCAPMHAPCVHAGAIAAQSYKFRIAA